MFKYILYVAVLFFSFQALAQPLPAAVILENSSYPPYVMPENQSGGPGIDMEIAMTALEKMGVRTMVKLVPFKRVLAMLEEGQADLTTSLSYRPDRDAYLYWSLPYRTDTNYVFFTRKDSAFQPERIEDLRGRKVGVVRGFVFPSAFAVSSAEI